MADLDLHFPSLSRNEDVNEDLPSKVIFLILDGHFPTMSIHYPGNQMVKIAPLTGPPPKVKVFCMYSGAGISPLTPVGGNCWHDGPSCFLINCRNICTHIQYIYIYIHTYTNVCMCTYEYIYIYIHT